MSSIPEKMQSQYAALDKMRAMMETMKKNQSLRGEDGLRRRMEARASKPQKTWRQMKGMQLVVHEINHPGNKPFAIGLA